MPEEIAVLALSSMIMVTALGFGIMRSINRHLERKHGGSGRVDVLRAEVDELRARVEDVDELRDRFIDLEERLDFAERLLARERTEDDPRLSSGAP